MPETDVRPPGVSPWVEQYERWIIQRSERTGLYSRCCNREEGFKAGYEAACKELAAIAQAKGAHS